MIRRPPRSTRTDTLFPYTTLFRSDFFAVGRILRRLPAAIGCRDAQHARSGGAVESEAEALRVEPAIAKLGDRSRCIHGLPRSTSCAAATGRRAGTRATGLQASYPSPKSPSALLGIPSDSRTLKKRK